MTGKERNAVLTVIVSVVLIVKRGAAIDVGTAVTVLRATSRAMKEVMIETVAMIVAIVRRGAMIGGMMIVTMTDVMIEATSEENVAMSEKTVAMKGVIVAMIEKTVAMSVRGAMIEVVT